MKRPYENKPMYDPGRFRISLQFFGEVSQDDGAGGTTVQPQSLTIVKGVQEPIREGSQLAIEAGATSLNQDCYYVIRARGFTPNKDMIINGEYVVRAVIPLGVPVTYYKLLCIRKK